jgi:hypothetical protein
MSTKAKEDSQHSVSQQRKLKVERPGSYANPTSEVYLRLEMDSLDYGSALKLHLRRQ